MFARAYRAARCAGSRTTSSPRRARSPAARTLIELPIQRLRRRRRPVAGVFGRRGARPRGLRAGRTCPGRAALVGTGLAVAIPEGYAGFVQPRSGLAARHGLTVVNSPGLVDSGLPRELRVVLLNTDRDRTVRRRARDADRAARRSPIPELELVEVDELPSERGVRGFGSRRRDGRAAHPGLGDLRWKDACSSAATRSPARSTGSCPAAASTPARASSTRCTASSPRRSGSTINCRWKGRSRSSIRSPRRAASRRSTSCTSSSRRSRRAIARSCHFAGRGGARAQPVRGR